LLERSILIETSDPVRYPRPVTQRAGAFLSGGVDSLAVLCANRADYPLDHSGAIRDCLFVHGFDIGGLTESDGEIASYQQALNAVSVVAEDADAALIPIFTNVRHLYDDVHFWMYVFHGAALASTAHAFSDRLTNVSIASGFKIQNLGRKIAHPLVETNYSSTSLQVAVAGILYSRLDRVGLISDWPAALSNLRVCTRNPHGMLNCGVCEKCVRTMLQLLAFDSLKKSSAFPSQHVSPAMLDDIQFKTEYQDAWYRELIAPLTAQGRVDLVEVIQTKHFEFEKRLAWEQERDWKGAVKRFDRRWLGGNFYKAYSRIRNGASA
jgi:hypothetical protein